VVSNDGTTLYVGTIESQIIALDVSDGKLTSWQGKDIGETSSGGFGCTGNFSQPMSTYGTPVVTDEAVYLGGYDGYVYSFTIETGAQNEFETGDAIVGSPVIDGDTLFIGSTDGKIYALDLQLSSEPKWEFETGDQIWGTPAVDNGVVYIASTDHRLYALDATNGEEIWHFKAEAAILSTPVVYESTVYIGANDNKFYAINVNQEAKEAEAKWVFEGAGNWFWTKALIYDSKVWVGNLDNNVYAINIEDPEDSEAVLILEEGRITTPPVLVKVSDDKNMIVVGSEDGYLYTIDPEDTSTAQFYNLEAPILAPIYADSENGIIYVHAQDGDHVLYAINVETGKEIWHYTTSGE